MNEPDSDAESSLRESWSIGPLRPWLKMLAERQLPGALRGKVDPSDIAQQALADAWRGREDFRGSTHAERLAWLRTILTRVILRYDRDLLRTAKRGGGVEKSVADAIKDDSVRLEHLAVANQQRPDSIAQQAEQALRLAEALEKLPEDYRQVLTLRHLDELPFEQIGRRMNRSSAAARMLWVRALQSLKQTYGSE